MNPASLTVNNKKSTAMKLLYFLPLSHGGIADYAHEQANALVNLGLQVEMLTTSDFDHGKDRKYIINPMLHANTDQSNVLLSKLVTVKTLMANYFILARYIREKNYRCVLFGAFAEYLAPFWAYLFRRLKKQGISFAAVVHDPVRDYVVGPVWWHHKSIAAAYSFLDYAYVHYPIELPTYNQLPNLMTKVIPFAAYSSYAPRLEEYNAVKKELLNIPIEANVLLAFGHVRDNKNLDLVLSSLACDDSFYLIVAGRVLGHKQKPISYYKNCAKQLGVANRCRWINEFISEEEAAELHNICDLVVLTYSASFRSGSAALNTAIHYRKPCIASAGEGNLRYVVDKYNLGILVEPDSEVAIREGLLSWKKSRLVPEFKAYNEENTWERNARIILKTLSC